MPNDYFDVISGQTTGPTATLARIGLYSLSVGYGLVTIARNRAYDAGFFKAIDVGLPVISVGNITTGGTGKTPLVAWCVQQLQELGRTPAILSRGYRADASGTNDELRVLETLCPGVPHVQNRDRVSAALSVKAAGTANAVVLDDGFQHRRIGRSLNLVLIDATNPFGYGHLLPRGLLRERLSGLQRADFVILTRIDQATPAAITEIHRILDKAGFRDRTAEVAFQPTRLISNHGEITPLAGDSISAAAGFCAIGNPEGFRRTLLSLGIEVPLKAFPDHHHYTVADLESVTASISSDKPLLLTTLKDLVKLQGPEFAAGNIHAVDIAPVFQSGEPALRELLRQAVEKAAVGENL